MAAIDEFDDAHLLLAFVGGALVLELAVHCPWRDRAPAWFAATAWAMTTWSIFWVLTVATFGRGWEVELYPGSVLLCTGLAAALAVVGRHTASSRTGA